MTGRQEGGGLPAYVLWLAVQKERGPGQVPGTRFQVSPAKHTKNRAYSNPSWHLSVIRRSRPAPKIPPFPLPSCRFASPNSSKNSCKSSSFIKSLIPAPSSNTSRAVGSEITNRHLPVGRLPRRQQLENTNLQQLLVDLLVALLLPLPLPRGRHDLSVPQEATHETHHQELPGLIRYPGQGGAEPQEGRLLQESARASQAAVVLKRILYNFFF